jgi:hypothetical protein
MADSICGSATGAAAYDGDRAPHVEPDGPHEVETVGPDDGSSDNQISAGAKDITQSW